jgi:hypothetical protein
MFLFFSKKLSIFTVNLISLNMICLEDIALYKLIEKVIEAIPSAIWQKEDKWISADEAMFPLRIKSKTTLQKLRDEGKIRCSQLGKRFLLYDRDSISDYLDDFMYETFNLK